MNAQGDPSIRPAGASDLDAIWAIESAEFGSDAWSREMMRDELTAPHRSYFALVDGAGAVQGYAGLLVVGDEGDVQTIAVAPAARGAGHGRLLMGALLDVARERSVHQVFLEVRADNPVARGLYESLGFAEIGVRPRYYQPDGVDAIVMRLPMAPARAADASEPEQEGTPA
ncbi:ribosomal protein S18-alanine N-acetyltransferase [Leucobacter sp. CSA2]|uniref:Ribosomal protein S18-alanine N-acetyltransferase n=1 Tax=Leucobacter edaphi TaxID=2796472 RepID=A0A934QCN4_9MICO|nr:ribosomal protein S18-alanine N-acetyltransferase [Leucobacter edaphi]